MCAHSCKQPLPADLSHHLEGLTNKHAECATAGGVRCCTHKNTGGAPERVATGPCFLAASCNRDRRQHSMLKAGRSQYCMPLAKQLLVLPATCDDWTTHANTLLLHAALRACVPGAVKLQVFLPECCRRRLSNRSRHACGIAEGGDIVQQGCGAWTYLELGRHGVRVGMIHAAVEPVEGRACNAGGTKHLCHAGCGAARDGTASSV